MPKNIVVFSDGTRCDGGTKFNSNVYKTFNLIKDRSKEQIAYYDKGLGTGWNKVSGALFGGGITKNIINCYRFIFEHYEDGDKIFLFGFSRGAATMRSLSGFIHLFGILPKSRPELIIRALKIYKCKDMGKRKQEAAEFLSKNKNMWCNIEFLGVWDTVASLGFPNKTLDFMVTLAPFFRHKFHDFSVSESVKHAYHALALDEHRQAFSPLMFNNTGSETQTVKQVWFCGSHSDVGGGYASTGLSDITLVWMLDMATKYGLTLYDNTRVVIRQNVNGIIHDESKVFPSKLLRRKQRRWQLGDSQRPCIHESVLERASKHSREGALYQPWILAHEYDVEPWRKNDTF